MKATKNLSFLLILLSLGACQNDDTEDTDTTTTTNYTYSKGVNQTRGACNETLTFTSRFTQSVSGTNKIFTSNSIPSHKVGLFGSVSGSINPNAISEQSLSLNVPANPVAASNYKPLLDIANKTLYEFGILLNGVELDPVAAEPFPHKGSMDPEANWEWNLEALNVAIGLDCNNAHVQPTGKYHYHSSPVGYLASLGTLTNKMTLVGYAADGFPVYYKYAYSSATNSSSAVVAMTSSFRLKSGTRPGDGVTAPNGTYNGVYSNDYEYVSGLGTLDIANGRTGVTPEYPSGTYYYIITEEFPSIPRYFRGTPSTSFKIF